MKFKAATESQHGQALMKWARLMQGEHPELALLFHIPNGGSRRPVEAAIMKGEGVKAGVPDYFLPAPKGEVHGLFLELKRDAKAKVSLAQKEWIERLNKSGYRAEIARGWEEAAKVISDYLS